MTDMMGFPLFPDISVPPIQFGDVPDQVFKATDGRGQPYELRCWANAVGKGTWHRIETDDGRSVIRVEKGRYIVPQDDAPGLSRCLCLKSDDPLAP